MRVLVCVKRVPAPGARINLSSDGTEVDTSMLGFTMSPHEECALEEGVRLVERHGGECAVVTLGPPEAEEQLRYAAGVGAQRLILVPTDGSERDPQGTAAALVRVVSALEREGDRFDLILFGNESADSGGHQVGVRVAVALDRPMVSGLKGLEVEEGVVVAARPTDAGVETYRLTLPAVVGVKEGINLPRYPTMRGRLAARKARIDHRVVESEPGGMGLIGLIQPPVAESRTVVLGHGPEAAPAVVDVLAELGLS